jgi:hypothetical protein
LRPAGEFLIFLKNKTSIVNAAPSATSDKPATPAFHPLIPLNKVEISTKVNMDIITISVKTIDFGLLMKNLLNKDAGYLQEKSSLS